MRDFDNFYLQFLCFNYMKYVGYKKHAFSMRNKCVFLTECVKLHSAQR